MKLIVITPPDEAAEQLEEEIQLVNALFRAGLQLLHLRKPTWTAAQMEEYILKVEPPFRPRLVLHDHHALAQPLGLHGIHLNGRNPQPPLNYKGSVSCSCHSLEEVSQRKAGCDYLFLSPVFDSISKLGYGSAFTPEVLEQAHAEGVIDRKVVALGGVSLEHAAQLKAWGFGGVALLGDVWNRPKEERIEHLEAWKRLLY